FPRHFSHCRFLSVSALTFLSPLVTRHCLHRILAHPHPPLKPAAPTLPTVVSNGADRRFFFHFALAKWSVCEERNLSALCLGLVPGLKVSHCACQYGRTAAASIFRWPPLRAVYHVRDFHDIRQDTVDDHEGKR